MGINWKKRAAALTLERDSLKASLETARNNYAYERNGHAVTKGRLDLAHAHMLSAAEGLTVRGDTHTAELLRRVVKG